MKKILVTDFAKRQFKKEFSGTKITDKTPEEFEEGLSYIKEIDTDERVDSVFFQGQFLYWKRQGDFPFSRLITIPNFTNAKLSELPITLDNVQYLRSDYFARTEKELPVLSRFFELPTPIKKPLAENLTIVLYSKGQLDKEGRETEGTDYVEFGAEWGIVSIISHNGMNMSPMLPITMLRNSLGLAEGGNGVPLDREKYLHAVEYWSKHAIIK